MSDRNIVYRSRGNLAFEKESPGPANPLGQTTSQIRTGPRTEPARVSNLYAGSRLPLLFLFRGFRRLLTCFLLGFLLGRLLCRFLLRRLLGCLFLRRSFLRGGFWSWSSSSGSRPFFRTFLLANHQLFFLGLDDLFGVSAEFVVLQRR